MPTFHDIDDARGAEHIDSRDLIELRDTLRSELEDADQAEAFELREGIAAIDELESEGIEDWPTSYIDWPAAARALAQDYSLVHFLGHDYYVR